uniref:EF-hand domain-containing protein n=1 Tax=Alexandrium monilatum TaxID=311494 RepID=A0A6T0V0D7_9DINO
MMARPSSQPEEGPGRLSAALAELQECHGLGQISQQEFDDLRRRLLDGFALRTQRCRCSSPGRHLGARACEEGSAAALEAHAASLAATKNDSLPSVPKLKLPVLEADTTGEDSAHRQLSARGLKQTLDSSQRDRARESEADFWCKWMKRRSSQATDNGDKRIVNQASVHDIIDVTAGRIDDVFGRFDRDGDGHLNLQELAVALESQGFHIDFDSAAELAAHVSDLMGDVGGCRATVTVREFDTMMTRLRLAELFTPYAGLFQWSAYDGGEPVSPIACCDYRESLFQLHYNVGERPDFFFGSGRPLSQAKLGNAVGDVRKTITRWVHMDATRGLDRLNLLRLAVKYHLHPLHIEDVIENRTMTKFECSQKNYFISADLLSLAQDSTTRNGRVRIHRSHVSIFLSGSPSWDTLLTIHQDRPDESSWLALWRRVKAHPENPCTGIWEALQKDLGQEPARRMREEGADFLLNEVLHRIVIELRPIGDAYAKRLGFMYQGSFRHFPNAWLTELGEVELELTDLSRSIRPMRQLLKHLLGDERIHANSRVHLEDVEDMVSEMMEDLSQLQQMARYLQEANERQRDKKMNDTLFVLSIISAIFLPAQFITGLYGMNFEYGGKPSIPELTWQNGYLWFWLWQGVALITAVVVLYLVSNGVMLRSRLAAASCGCCSRHQRPRTHSMDGVVVPATAS